MLPSQQLAYHYSLIPGMPAAPVFLGLVAACWLLYAVKVVQFVWRVLDSPEGLFLVHLRNLPPRRSYGLLWRVQQRLFLPVSGYAAAIIGVALFEGEWRQGLLVAIYVFVVGFVPVPLYYWRLEATRGLWYRALPVSLVARLGQYAIFDLLLLLPELLIMAWLTPHPIVMPLRVSDFLKLWLVIFGIWYACVLGGFLIAMSGFFAGAAVVVFFGGYNRVRLR